MANQARWICLLCLILGWEFVIPHTASAEAKDTRPSIVMVSIDTLCRAHVAKFLGTAE